MESQSDARLAMQVEDGGVCRSACDGSSRPVDQGQLKNFIVSRRISVAKKKRQKTFPFFAPFLPYFLPQLFSFLVTCLQCQLQVRWQPLSADYIKPRMPHATRGFYADQYHICNPWRTSARS